MTTARDLEHEPCTSEGCATSPVVITAYCAAHAATFARMLSLGIDAVKTLAMMAEDTAIPYWRRQEARGLVAQYRLLCEERDTAG